MVSLEVGSDFYTQQIVAMYASHVVEFLSVFQTLSRVINSCLAAVVSLMLCSSSFAGLLFTVVQFFFVGAEFTYWMQVCDC